MEGRLGDAIGNSGQVQSLIAENIFQTVEGPFARFAIVLHVSSRLAARTLQDSI